MINTRALGLVLMLTLTSCAAYKIDSASKKHRAVADQIDLGDSKEAVLAVLLPTQEGLSAGRQKPPEKYLKDGVKVEIYFMRSGRQPDGLTTDDEFTPYLFNDGALVAIGWSALGGPKTQGQATSDTYISNSNTTVVY